ncbi:MAG: metallophosphoesterase, partial [Acidimicrobiia bacterium]|nr:metallophosphoesterase [Acidimicrobiia bacterium]
GALFGLGVGIAWLGWRDAGSSVAADEGDGPRPAATSPSAPAPGSSAPAADSSAPAADSSVSAAGSSPTSDGGKGAGKPSVLFTAGGDLGAQRGAIETLGHLRDLAPRVHLLLGDLAYQDLQPEASWCEFVLRHAGRDLPIEVVSGNHEDDNGGDGHITNFVGCMADRMDSVGEYGIQYSFDIDELVRVVMITPDIKIEGKRRDYDPGSPERAWLDDAITGARADGIPWVVVGMHKNCVTMGVKGCEIGPGLVQYLIDTKVDLILQGHEHNYQRAKQLSCVKVDLYDPACVVDDGADAEYAKGAGPVLVINGSSGDHGLVKLDPADPEAGYFVVGSGRDDPGSGAGVLEIEATTDELSVAYVSTTGSFKDAFVIR